MLSPIGFVADHIEVLYDLDIEARETCEAEGIAFARASAVNDHPRFLDALAERGRLEGAALSTGTAAAAAAGRCRRRDGNRRRR